MNHVTHTRFASDSVLVIAHRGSSHNYPENTILAFDKAFEEGAHGIELDVHRSADGELVVMHDRTVDRTTAHQGRIDCFTVEELTAMDAGHWCGTEFTGRPDTRVPTLKQILDRYRDKPVFIVIQVKGDLEEIRQTYAEVSSRGMSRQCFVFSNREQIGALKARFPEALVMNDGMRHPREALLEMAIAQHWDAVSNGLTHMEANWIRQAHNHGILVQASFITEDFAIWTRHLLDLGVNFLLGNDAAAISGVVAEKGLRQIVPKGCGSKPRDYSI